MDACPITAPQSKKRRTIAITFILCLLIIFWAASRYPDLYKEYSRSVEERLVDRDVGALSKDEMISRKDKTTHFQEVATTSLNWFDTNKYGMSFGILLATAILLLLEQSQFLMRFAEKRGVRGILSGLLLGIPLGICTNCATPVSLGMKRAGASLEAAFATLVASPSLNPIGLFIIFYLLPHELGFLRVVVLLGFLVFLLPIFLKGIEVKNSVTRAPAPMLDESWGQALSASIQTYGRHLKYILLRVLPPMIIIGLLAAIFVTYYPLEKFALVDSDTIGHIFLASIIGSLLPMPMFVDIVVVVMLLDFGLPMSLAATLIITLAPTSLYALYVMGQNVSWRASALVTGSITCLGFLCGVIIHYYTFAPSVEFKNKGNHFLPIELNGAGPAYDNFSLKNFFGAGVSAIDFDNDGLVDLFIPGANRVRLLKNLGGMRFKDITASSGISSQYNSVAGIWGDFNNDGLIDLYLVNYKNKSGLAEPNKLYQNLGGGVFKDVGATMGLVEKDMSSSASWGDIDNDGDLDLFVANYGSLHLGKDNVITGNSKYDRLYLNDKGRFKDITLSAGVTGAKVETNTLRDVELESIPGNRGFSFQPVWFDYNDDDRLDLFVASDFGTSQLYKNLGNARFENVTYAAGLNHFGTGMGAHVFDINQDGLFDIYVTTTENNLLFINKGTGRFEEAAKRWGLNDAKRAGWGVVDIDVNNSGRRDLWVVNGPMLKNASRTTVYEKTLSELYGTNSFFARLRDESFIEANRAFGLFNTGMGRGAAAADFDNDGYQDMVITNRDGTPVIIYKNEGGEKKSLKIRLMGKEANKNAFGARVSVTVGDAVQHQVLMSGSSYLSQHSGILLFGLGEASKADKVIIRWPGGKRQILFNLKAGRTLTVTEP